MGELIFETIEYLIIAFISSAILIFLSKVVLQALIRRPADYYTAEELRQEELMLNSAGISIKEELETTPEGEVTGEHIHAEPRISLEEFLKLHIKDPESIPNILKNAEIRTAAEEALGSAAEKAAEEALGSSAEQAAEEALGSAADKAVDGAVRLEIDAATESGIDAAADNADDSVAESEKSMESD